MTKLLRDGVLIAEGKTYMDLEDGIALFSVKKWHVTQHDAHPWKEEAEWLLQDAKRARKLTGKARVVGVQVDGVTIATLDLACQSPAGPLVVDVRDA